MFPSPGIGDIVAICTLIIKVGTAISESRGVPQEYEELSWELNALDGVLQTVKTSYDPSLITEADPALLRIELQAKSCEDAMNEFLKDNELPRSRSQKAGWAIQAPARAASLRQKLSAYRQVLDTFLSEFRAQQQSAMIMSNVRPIMTSSPVDPVIALDSIDGNAIANGGFASVYIGWANGSKVAIKVLRVTRDCEQTAIRRLRREILVWRQLQDDYITPLLGVAHCADLSSLEAMITPWYEHGTSEEYIGKAQPDLQARLLISLCVSKGLCYLHQLDPVIVHGDLKPSNILIDDELRPRICDFGLARIVNEEGGGGFTTTTPHLGTARYAAPEILMTPDEAPSFMPSTESDIYSLGSVIYQFLTEIKPFRDRKSAMQIISDVVRGIKPAKRPSVMTDIERDQWDLFEACWAMSPEQRPKSYQVVALLDSLTATTVVPLPGSMMIEYLPPQSGHPTSKKIYHKKGTGHPAIRRELSHPYHLVQNPSRKYIPPPSSFTATHASPTSSRGDARQSNTADTASGNCDDGVDARGDTEMNELMDEELGSSTHLRMQGAAQPNPAAQPAMQTTGQQPMQGQNPLALYHQNIVSGQQNQMQQMHTTQQAYAAGGMRPGSYSAAGYANPYAYVAAMNARARQPQMNGVPVQNNLYAAQMAAYPTAQKGMGMPGQPMQPMHPGMSLQMQMGQQYAMQGQPQNQAQVQQAQQTLQIRNQRFMQEIKARADQAATSMAPEKLRGFIDEAPEQLKNSPAWANAEPMEKAKLVIFHIFRLQQLQQLSQQHAAQQQQGGNVQG